MKGLGMVFGKKLSVIVPVYTMAAGEKLAYCLDSLVAQEVEGLEIVAVDDASTDESPEILREYEERYPEVVRVVALSENRRQGGAKNEGLRYARGKWIGFVDSDDWVSPDCYRKLLDRAGETGADVVGCAYSLVGEHTMVPGSVVYNNTADQTGVLDEEKHRKLIVRPGSMVIKIYDHQVIKENHLDFPEKIFYEDNCAGSVWSLYFKQFEMVTEPLYFYYQHETSTVHRVSWERCLDRMKAGELLVEEFEKRGFLDTYRAEVEYRFTELYYKNTLFSYMQGVRFPSIGKVGQLGNGIMRYFPNYEKNSYYQAWTETEEQMFMAMQKKSNLLFYIYYQLKWAVRKVRYRYGRIGNHYGQRGK
jgi:glycosyltransferase involved in cell wall biosynthesis